MNTLTSPLRVLFLGPLRDRVGCARAEIVCPADGTQAAFWKALREKMPALGPFLDNVRLARNNEFLDPGAALAPGDEIALIPPVSGG
jgi:molybdopterin converting factor small subunit